MSKDKEPIQPQKPEKKEDKTIVKEAALSLVRKLENIVQALHSTEVRVGVECLIKKVLACFEAGGKLIVFGNGGSSSDASHFCAEFTGRFKKTRRGLPAICLNDSSFLTAVANDFSFDRVFERGVDALGSKGDLVIAISTSGSSPNCLFGLYRAEELGLDNFALVGRSGGDMCRYYSSLNVGMDSTDEIQELHMMILHTVVEVVENRLVLK